MFGEAQGRKRCRHRARCDLPNPVTGRRHFPTIGHWWAVRSMGECRRPQLDHLRPGLIVLGHFLLEEFYPEFSLTTSDLPNCQIYLKLMIDGAISAINVHDVHRSKLDGPLAAPSGGYVAGLLSRITHPNQDLDPSNLRGPRSWLLCRHFEQGDRAAVTFSNFEAPSF